MTLLSFSLGNASKVAISVVDAVGRTVATIADATLQPGAHQLNIPVSALASGMYHVTIRSEEGVLTQRLSVVK